MEERPTVIEMEALRSHLESIDGVTTTASRPGSADEGRFQGYVSLRVQDHEAVDRLLAHLGEPFWAIFHVGSQKCELGFRVEVTRSQQQLRYDLRFWGCPKWGLHRIRRYLTRRVAGAVDRDGLPSMTPPPSGEHPSSDLPPVPTETETGG